VRQVDPALDATLQAQLAASVAAVAAIPQPFDQSDAGADDSPGRDRGRSGDHRLFAQGGQHLDGRRSARGHDRHGDSGAE
jgi:putative iron-regulated protein